MGGDPTGRLGSSLEVLITFTPARAAEGEVVTEIGQIEGKKPVHARTQNIERKRQKTSERPIPLVVMTSLQFDVHSVRAFDVWECAQQPGLKRYRYPPRTRCRCTSVRPCPLRRRRHRLANNQQLSTRLIGAHRLNERGANNRSTR